MSGSRANPTQELRDASPPEASGSADLPSAMAQQFNLAVRWFARRFFGHFELDPEKVEMLRAREAEGSVVYVMRYASRLDYFLFNALFLRENLRLSRFANGIRFIYVRPLGQLLRSALRGPWSRPRQVLRSEERQIARSLSLGGESFFLFLRTAKIRDVLRRRQKESRQDELDLLLEVVRSTWDTDQQVSVVPLVLFWRKGPRTESRFLNLDYGAPTRPSDLAKMASFLATYRSLAVKIGDPIDLSSFVASRREEGLERVAKKVRRSILFYFYREEKVVEGPTLRSRHHILEEVIRDPRVRQAIAVRATQKRNSPDKARREAEKFFFAIAAHMNSTFLAALAGVAGWMLRRMFASIEVTGLDRVAEYARWNPIVLVPNHRSYFDFLIVSWLFYVNYLIPPHIYARDNMAFGPFGFIFRRCGAFFARGKFDDPLYKEVFRSYVNYLVREGVTQEFFIEGGRSRTGKTLAPRFGMLTWDLDAFLASSRRDIFFVPVALTYERLVDEGSLVGEQRGGEKKRESVLGLVRARKFLYRRFGMAHVNFGEPLSLSGALGERRKEFSRAGADENEGERRQFVESLAHRIVERINAATAANSTAVAASVLLGNREKGMRREEFISRMRDVVDVLRLQDVRLTGALVAEEGDFGDSLLFLERSELIGVSAGPRDTVVFFEESARRALDLYRNSIAHFLAAPSFLARRLLAGGASLADLREDLGYWQDLLYREYFMPRGEVLAAHFDAFIDHFLSRGWIRETAEGDLEATSLGRAPLESFEAQTRGILEVYLSLLDVLCDDGVDLRRKEVIHRSKANFECARLLGEVGRLEAMNDTTLSNGLDLLLRLGIIEEDPDDASSKDPGFRKGGAWPQLHVLSDSLARAVRGL